MSLSITLLAMCADSRSAVEIGRDALEHLLRGVPGIEPGQAELFLGPLVRPQPGPGWAGRLTELPSIPPEQSDSASWMRASLRVPRLLPTPGKHPKYAPPVLGIDTAEVIAVPKRTTWGARTFDGCDEFQYRLDRGRLFTRAVAAEVRNQNLQLLLAETAALATSNVQLVLGYGSQFNREAASAFLLCAPSTADVVRRLCPERSLLVREDETDLLLSALDDARNTACWQAGKSTIVYDSVDAANGSLHALAAAFRSELDGR